MERALTHALAWECSNPVLADLAVVAVHPAPDARRMAVVVRSTTVPPVDADEVAGHLDRAAGFLRSVVAREIHRRKTPELAFYVDDPEVRP